MMPRRNFLLLCLLNTISIIGFSKPLHKLVTVKGHVTQTSDYCGGAMPTEELLAVLKSKRPNGQKSIYIKVGSMNKWNVPILKKIITDDNGDFSVTLKSGSTYTFIEEWKSEAFRVPKNTEYIKWDADCLYKRYQQADFVLKLKNGTNSTVNINYHIPCFFKPFCGEYSGPLPP